MLSRHFCATRATSLFTFRTMEDHSFSLPSAMADSQSQSLLEDGISALKLVTVQDFTPTETLENIEQLVLQLFSSIASKKPFDLEFVQRASRNSEVSNGATRLGERKKVWSAKGRTARNYSRAWILLDFIHKLSCAGKSATQRDVYYSLLAYFRDQTELNNLVQDISALLLCTRSSLSISASAKGVVTGRLVLQDGRTTTDLTNSLTGLAITERITALVQNSTSEARYILVVEKEAVFVRLAEDRLTAKIPAILVTGKGVPDLATRALVRALQDKYQIPVLGLFDYNAGGINVWLTYRLGSARMVEAYNHVLNVAWLGLRAQHVKELELAETATAPARPRDLKRIETLLETPFFKSHPIYAAELKSMLEYGRTVELQALQVEGYKQLTSLVERMILRKHWQE